MQRIALKISIILLLFYSLTAFAADDVKLTASAPGTVVMGRPFQIKYTANAKISDFRAPAITNFDILAGPFKSESYSSQVINGQMSSSVAISFTYTLQAQKTGTFSIPSASVTVDNEKVTSTGITIKVLPADDNASQQQQTTPSHGSTAASSISAQNIFIRPILSKTNVYENEAFKLSYKIYTTYDIIDYNIKNLPDYKGFMKQETERSGNTQLAYENYNGKNYLTAVLYEIILYPQSSGEHKIEKTTFEAIIRVQSKQQVRSIFDEFFESYTNVARQIEVPQVKVKVKKLPQGRPDTFTGVVGNFNITSTVSSTQVKVNEAVTLKLNITGSGNMKLIKNPDFKFPESFEVYDPVVKNDFKPTNNGLTGTKSIEITFIPRHAGSFEIPATETAYFSASDNSYKILKTPVFNIQVLKSDGSVEESVVNDFSQKEDIKKLGDDIRYIYTGQVNLIKEENYLFDRFSSWLLGFFIPLFIALGLFIAFRKHVRDNSDIELVKNKRANRIARKRLRFASKLLQAGDKEKFYAEVMNAIWTYLSDKLIIPVAELNKEKVTEVLESRNVSSETLSRLMNILNTCEFARFAPGTGQQEMGNLYEETIGIISELEHSVKNQIV